MEYAGGVRDWILARFDDLHPVEQGIEPAPSPSSQYDREGSAGHKSWGRCWLRQRLRRIWC